MSVPPPPPYQSVPLRVVQAGEFWTVLGPETSDGPRVMAQGSRALCELVAAGRPIFVEPGDLFECKPDALKARRAS